MEATPSSKIYTKKMRWLQVVTATEYLVAKFGVLPGQNYAIHYRRRSDFKKDIHGERMMAYRIESPKGPIVLYESEIRHL